MNRRKQAFLNTLKQGSFWAGIVQSSGHSLCETYFYGGVPKMLEDTYGFQQEKVYQHDTDEFSGNLHTVWKFIIPAYREYSALTPTEYKEEVFYLRFEGFYCSHEGSEYTDFREVSPEQKTITVYE